MIITYMVLDKIHLQVPHGLQERRQISRLLSLCYWTYRGAVSESTAERARRVSWQGSQDKGAGSTSRTEAILHTKAQEQHCPQRQMRKD